MGTRNIIEGTGFRMMSLRQVAAAASVAMAVALPGAALADVPFIGGFGEGSLPGAVDAGTSEVGTLTVLGIWKPNTASGSTSIRIELPEYAVLNGTPTATVAGRLNGSQDWDKFFGHPDPIFLKAESDYVCGINGFDVDPTTGDLFVMAGRTSGKPSSTCRTHSRYLAKYDSNSGTLKWLAYQYAMKHLEFLGDGTLLGTAGSAGANGRGTIHSYDKSTGAQTYEANPGSGNRYRDLAYNPDDGYLYVIDYCYLIRVNPSDWSSTEEYRSELCDLRRMAASYVGDNTIQVRMNSGYYNVKVNPADGTFVSITAAGSHGSSYPWYPMIASLTDPATSTAACSGSGRIVTCTVSSLTINASVAVKVPYSLNVPDTAKPGTRLGSVAWSKGGVELKSAKLNLGVRSPDVGVSVSPTSGRYYIDDTFAITVDASALGGMDIDSANVELIVPGTLVVTSVSGSAGSCGLSKAGARCAGMSISAGGTETMTVNVRAVADGGAPVKARVVVDGGDVEPANDTATANFIVGNAADMVATGTEGGKGSVGKAMALEVEVWNEGPDTAQNAKLFIPADAGFSLGTATTDLGSCATATEGITCAFGNMGLATTATVSLQVTPNKAGNLILNAKASSDYVDSPASNSTYAFQVTVPTVPFSVALGAATPTAGDSDIIPILQVAVTPASGSKQGIRVVGAAGTLKLTGNAVKQKVLVYTDEDGNGAIDATDTFLGSGALSASGDTFSLDFQGAVSAPAGKTSTFLLAVQKGSGLAAAPFTFPTSTNWLLLAMAGLLPVLLGGMVFGRRRVAYVAAALLVVGAVGACSDDDAGSAGAKARATLTSLTATLLDDVTAKVDATGLPIEGSSISLK